jgi:hypothetical protein
MPRNRHQDEMPLAGLAGLQLELHSDEHARESFSCAMICP